MLPGKHVCFHSIIGDKLTEGAIVSSGSNRWGQLGTGDTTSRLEFTSTNRNLKVSSISCGLYQTAVIRDKDGSIGVFGLNHALYLREYAENENLHDENHYNSHQHYELISELNVPIVFLPVKVRFSSVVVGNRFLAALDEKGFVYHFSEVVQSVNPKTKCGSINHVQNLNTFLCGIMQLSAGPQHLLALDTKGTVWRVNPHGLDEPQSVEMDNPILEMASGSSYDLFRDSYDRVISMKHGDAIRILLYLCRAADGSSKSIRVQCGSHSSYITDGLGVVRVFGCNNYGQLALGDNYPDYVIYPTVNRSLKGMKLFPIQNWMFAMDSMDVIYACGNNCSGQLGMGDRESRWSLEPVPLSFSSDNYNDKQYDQNERILKVVFRNN